MTEIKKSLNDENELVLDEGSVLSEVLERLKKGTVDKFRTEGTYNEFKFIVSVCFPPLVSAKHWKRNKGVVAVSDLLTLSDEALALIVLENNYEEWIDIAKGIEIDKKNRKTKYTHGGQRNNGTKKGWSLEGRERFNTIFTNVKVERERAESKQRENRLMTEWGPKKKTSEDSTTNADKELNEEEEQYQPMTDFDFE